MIGESPTAPHADERPDPLALPPLEKVCEFDKVKRLARSRSIQRYTLCIQVMFNMTAPGDADSRASETS